MFAKVILQVFVPYNQEQINNRSGIDHILDLCAEVLMCIAACVYYCVIGFVSRQGTQCSLKSYCRFLSLTTKNKSIIGVVLITY